MPKSILDIDAMKALYISLLLLVSGVSQATDWTYASWMANEAYTQVINESICTSKLTAIDPDADSAFMCSRGGDTAISWLALSTAPEATDTLANLLAVGGNTITSETLSCSIHAQGKAVLLALKSLQPAKARQKCLETVAAGVKTMTSEIEVLLCSIHEQGLRGLPALKSLQTTQARQKCLKAVAGLQEKLHETVCLSEEMIAERRNDHIRKATEGGHTCKPWEY
ncbi:MAG: hypothetical protein LBU76_03340 [Azoarcus sp.]|jgi:hypothetical protein|nr:hypothetical protein [Azoarcus sp.]